MKTINSFQQFDELFDRLMGVAHEPSTSGRILPIDVFETENAFVVHAAVPGVEPHEIGVQVENGVLTIRAERRAENEESAKIYRRENAYGTFSRSLRLSDRLNTEEIAADYRNGVITLTIPRIPEPKPKTINVSVSAPSLPSQSVIAGETAESAN